MDVDKARDHFGDAWTRLVQAGRVADKIADPDLSGPLGQVAHFLKRLGEEELGVDWDKLDRWEAK